MRSSATQAPAEAALTQEPFLRRDHGGDLDRARARFGGGDWIDLSTGINRAPYPVPALTPAAWRDLPTREMELHLRAVAASVFAAPAANILPMAGASAPILLLPRLLRPRRAAVLSPTYNEHAASLRAAGCEVSTPAQVQALAGADLAVVVNPNNPDGRCFSPGEIAEIAGRCRWLIVDESFADPRPDLSVAGLGLPNVIVLRSFGKFWGLAGLRLGFAIGPPEVLDGLQELAGPWPVSGPALEIGVIALADRTWASETVTWLSEAALRLDQLALRAGFQLVGGAHLFRLYQTGDAIATQARLAQAQIWSRVFPYHPGWIRLGIPGNSGEFDRVGAALNDL